MLRYLILAIVLMMLIGTVLAAIVAFIVSVLTIAAVVAVIALPIWYISRHHLGARSSAQPPLERLKNLYVEGKIDLFEFERRVERLLAIEK
ncbi:MAG TPA: hypothetical protein VFA78_03175 [Chloroflexota bacterium]|nr:hypothetical protein [Chloroflexota bacterium]